MALLLIFNSFDVKWKFSLPRSKYILYSYVAHVVHEVDKLARHVFLGMIDSGRCSSKALNSLGCQNFITLRQALSSPLSGLPTAQFIWTSLQLSFHMCCGHNFEYQSVVYLLLQKANLMVSNSQTLES